MDSRMKRTSRVWNYFTAIDGLTASCDICSMKLSYKSTVSNLMKHIKRKHSHCITKVNEIADDQNDVIDDAANTSTKEIKPRPVRSPIWKYFTKLDGMFAKCELCSKKLSFKSTVSNLVKHMKRAHAEAYLDMKTEGAEDDDDDDVEKYVVFSDNSSEAGESGQRVTEEDQLWNYFERETGGRARCVLCGTALPTHAAHLTAHLKQHHTKIAHELGQDSDTEVQYVDLEAEDGDLISKIVYLEDANERTEAKRYPTTDRTENPDSYKRKSRREAVPVEKYRMTPTIKRSLSDHSEDDNRPVILVASHKKNDIDADDKDMFSKYITHLLKSLPKHIQTKLQMEVVNIIMKAKLEHEAKLQETVEMEKNVASTTRDPRYCTMLKRKELNKEMVCKRSVKEAKDETVIDSRGSDDDMDEDDDAEEDKELSSEFITEDYTSGVDNSDHIN